jgi:imidazolonepropionase-like amidohydrolase
MGKEVARRFVTEGGLVVVNGRNAAKTETAADKVGSLEVGKYADFIVISPPSPVFDPAATIVLP